MTLDLDAHKKDDKLLITTIQQEYKILAEYKMIESEKLSGIYVIPSYANSLQWFGVFFGRQGLYAESVFRFTILLPDRFPDDKSLPTIIFQQDVIHPHVCPYTHSLDVSHAFPEWRCGEDHLWQLLKYLQVIFSDPLDSIRGIEVDKLKNREAAELLMNNKEEYVARVQENIKESKEHIFDTPPTEDPNYIVFEKFQQDVHGPVLDRIKAGRSKQTEPSAQQGNGGHATGLSWVKEGEFKPLSIE
ncbi:protein crossbronx [Drosophila sechellia]|uniref:Protein crossbronx n=1 Tax=Drosophila sechellia TaxID=7238 RepID=AKTP1_DROSE|nr:protein crossbronx [Drosophila sechellia]XP_032571509.1 protein crossbronx [Drosophila sechellia]B4HT57.1 RecName: Full=Protein crossbronx [Drosophila sechellia]EDW47167.1 GM20572 [Drosophila sechellia]